MAFWGITARNEGQKRAMQALMNDKPYLFLTGPAGTGKTLVTQAVALHRTLELQQFRKIVYTRLQVQLGQDVGALPGSIDEKTYPFLRGFMDNFEVFSNKDALEYLVFGDPKKRKVFFDAIQTMRGGSFHHSFIMADESQNLDTATIGATATRLAISPDGRSSKMVFMGNFAQIDNPKLRRPEANGLYQLLHGLYERNGHEYFDHINLTEIERHPAIGLVEDILRTQDTMDKRFEELEARGNIE